MSDTMPCLQFPGGEVPIPKPTRSDLVLSAQQWATAVRECWLDTFAGRTEAADEWMSGKLDRLDAVLAELEELCCE